MVEARREGVTIGEFGVGVEEFLDDPGGGRAPSDVRNTIGARRRVVCALDRVIERGEVRSEVGTREGERVGKNDVSGNGVRRLGVEDPGPVLLENAGDGGKIRGRRGVVGKGGGDAEGANLRGILLHGAQCTLGRKTMVRSRG